MSLPINRNAGVLAMDHGSMMGRRDFIRSVAMMIAAYAVSCRAETAAEHVGPVMVKLSNYMSAAREQPVPKAVMEETKHHILDSVAAMISGSVLPPGIAAIRFAKSYGGEKIATVAGSRCLCGPIEAALANGELAHSDETDDDCVKSGAHPGCSIIPAALAMAEKLGSCSGLQFIRAVTLGYDIGLRAYQTMGETSNLIETHILIGTIGCASACGSLANMNQEKMRWLLDYAMQQAGSGLRIWGRDTEHMEKGFIFGGAPARNGVTAALLVESGWTGVNDIFSGPDNFPESYAPHASPAGMVAELGLRYEVTLTTIKKWTTGGPIQAPLDAIVNLRKKRPFEASDVRSVVVHTSHSGKVSVDNRDMPDICLQHLVAVMLLDKTLNFRSAHDIKRMKDSAVLRERSKVSLVGENELEALVPKRVAIVDITLNDGSRLVERVDAVRGSPDNPMSREDIIAKARDLMEPVIGKANSSSLIDQLTSLETLKDMRQLRPLLQRG